jgi:hypothetical protein
LIIDEAVLRAAAFQPFAIYLDALALGYFQFQPNPEAVLDRVRLSQLHQCRDANFWAERAAELGLPALGTLRDRLLSGQPARFAYAGDRAALAECLIGMLPPDVVRRTSFATSLVPSSVRPFILTLVDPSLQ